jgi:hypothetical protein
MIRSRYAPLLWLAAVAWVFSGPLFADRVLYYRDVTVTYYPDMVFASGSLRQGVWPLWHPGADAGSRYLLAYPVHLLLLGVAGARATLALSPALHLLLAMAGAGALAGRLGCGSAGVAVAGAAFGLSGLMLGSVLYPVFLAAAWMPLAVERFLALVASPSRRRVALLGGVLALQVSTLGVEAVVATGLFALALVERLPGRRVVASATGAVALAAAVAAPALVGGLVLLEGTARGEGFAPPAGLAFSAPVPVLLEAALPRFLGETHGFTDAGYWGQPFFPTGSPFFLSLYLGPALLLLASRAGPGAARLWGLAGLGVLLALGTHGPLGPVMAAALPGTMRHPVKFFLLTSLALALLAGRGVERHAAGVGRVWANVPGLLLLGAAVAAHRTPASVSAVLSLVTPAAGGPAALDVIRTQWPQALASTGVLTLAVGLALSAGPRLARLAGPLAALDLLLVNGQLNPSTDAAFFDLRPAVRRVVDEARLEGPYRWFSYGVARSPALRWDPEVVRRNSDVWLFYIDRQALLPRTHVLDGLDGAFDLDRMGLAPAGSTLRVEEARPALFREHYRRLRLAGVRWVVGFHSLPDDLASLAATVPLPEVAEPLRLHELLEALPRAFWVAGAEVLTDAARRASRLEDPSFDPRGTVLLEAPPPPVAAQGDWSGEVRVEYMALDAHTVRIEARTPPGFVVVLDGHDPDWAAEEGSRPVPLLRANGRYRALPTSGGERSFTLRYRPRWRQPALVVAGAGTLAALVLLLFPGATGHPSPGTRRAILSRRVGE